MNRQEKHYTPRQLTEILPLSLDTVRRYCREGKFDAVVVVGNRIFISQSSLDRFLKEHRCEGVNA